MVMNLFFNYSKSRVYISIILGIMYSMYNVNLFGHIYKDVNQPLFSIQNSFIVLKIFLLSVNSFSPIPRPNLL